MTNFLPDRSCRTRKHAETSLFTLVAAPKGGLLGNCFRLNSSSFADLPKWRKPVVVFGLAAALLRHG